MATPNAQSRTFNEWYSGCASERIRDAGWQGIAVRDVRWQLQNAYRSGNEDGAGRLLDKLIGDRLAGPKEALRGKDAFDLKR